MIEADVVLTRRQQGALLCFALNALPSPSDFVAHPEDAQGCCPRCCAPCEVLFELAEAGTLNDAVRGAEPQLYEGWDWWDSASGGVYPAWLAMCWAPQNLPGHEHGEDESTPG